MDELDNLGRRAAAFEKQAKEAGSWEEAEEKKEPEAVIKSLPPLEVAGNRAESILKIAEAAAKMFVDGRLVMDELEIQNGRESLAPVLQKYNLVGDGTGRVPYQEEITAGFYIGGLFKRFMRAVATLRAYDKANAKANDQANQQVNQQANNQASNTQGQANGRERKHQSKEQSQSLPGEVGGGQVANPNEEVWNSPIRLQGVAVG